MQSLSDNLRDDCVEAALERLATIAADLETMDDGGPLSEFAIDLRGVKRTLRGFRASTRHRVEFVKTRRRLWKRAMLALIATLVVVALAMWVNALRNRVRLAERTEAIRLYSSDAIRYVDVSTDLSEEERKGTMLDDEYRDRYQRYVEFVEETARRSPPFDPDEPWENGYFLLEWVNVALGQMYVAKAERSLLQEQLDELEVGNIARTSQLQEEIGKLDQKTEGLRLRALERCVRLRNSEEQFPVGCGRLNSIQLRRLLNFESQVLGPNLINPSESDLRKRVDILRQIRDVRREVAEGKRPLPADIVTDNNLAWYLIHDPSSSVEELEEAYVAAKGALDAAGFAECPNANRSVVPGIWETYELATRTLVKNKRFPTLLDRGYSRESLAQELRVKRSQLIDLGYELPPTPTEQ